MENSGFERDTEKGSVELSDVTTRVNDVNKQPHTQPHACQPDLCRSMHTRYLQDKGKMASSPWDGLKTRFLVGIIALLGVWVLAYMASSSLGLV